MNSMKILLNTNKDPFYNKFGRHLFDIMDTSKQTKKYGSSIKYDIQPALKFGGNIDPALYDPANQTSNNFLFDVGKVLLPLAASALGAYLAKKGTEKIDSIINKNKNKNKNNDVDMDNIISEKSKMLLKNIISGGGITII
jgi:hypothetical protein